MFCLYIKSLQLIWSLVHANFICFCSSKLWCSAILYIWYVLMLCCVKYHVFTDMIWPDCIYSWASYWADLTFDLPPPACHRFNKFDGSACPCIWMVTIKRMSHNPLFSHKRVQWVICVVNYMDLRYFLCCTWPYIRYHIHHHRKSHCWDKVATRPLYLTNGISITGKVAYLFWIRPLVDWNKYYVDWLLKLCVV